MQSTRNIVLFDRTCAFCRGAVRFIIRHDPNAIFRFAALQSDAALALMGECGAETPRGGSLILIRDGCCHSKSDAALLIASALTGPWRFCRVLRVVPRRVRDGCYDLIARHRHRLADDGERSLVNEPGIRERFLGSNESDR